MMTNHNDKDLKIKLIQLVRETIERDKVLREKYEVVDKFRFVRDRLNAMLSHLERDLETTVEEEKIRGQLSIKEDEILVFVYLFNAKGAVLREWKNMVIPKVFHEYSVNRPIYAEKSQIDAFIRAKPNKLLHGYLTILIKKNNLLSETSSTSKDLMGNRLVKVKEGSLAYENLLSFTHNGIDYEVSMTGELVKKII